MKTAEKLSFVTNTRSGDSVAWINPDDVDSVQAIATRYGPRLVCHMRDSGAEVWIVDTEEARRKLELEA